MTFMKMGQLIDFYGCSMRKFNKGERHITRICRENVLILMLDGVLKFCEDGNDIELRSGEYYIQQNGLLQDGKNISDMPVYFYIHFTGAEFGCTPGDNTVPVRGTFSATDVSRYIKQFENFHYSSKRNNLVLNGVFLTILGMLNKTSDSDSKLSEEIEKFILNHFDESLFSLDDIKNRFNFSEEYIIKIFKSQFGITPYQYITDLRIKYAKQLLLSTNRTLSSIALDCGYSDYSVFYKNFVNKVGTSPKEWRKKTEFQHGNKDRLQ